MGKGTPIPQYEKATSIPENSTYIADMGDGSGTKGVTQETLTKEVGKGLKIGDLEGLQTEDKSSLVAAINEAMQSGGGASVDILDSKEEIEANTGAGKAAGALAVKEMFGELNDNFGGYALATTEDGRPGIRKQGADTVTPFPRIDDILSKQIINGSVPTSVNDWTWTADKDYPYLFLISLSQFGITGNTDVGRIEVGSTKADTLIYLNIGTAYMRICLAKDISQGQKITFYRHNVTLYAIYI